MVFLSLLTAALAAPGYVSDFYIGTYTSPNGSQGIYRAEINEATGALSEPVLAVKADNPSFVAVDPTHRYVYAVDEKAPGLVAAYRREANNDLSLLDEQPSGGSGPCHVSLDARNRTVFVANYDSGSLEALKIQADGSLSVPTTVFQNHGKGPNADRQEGPHLHSAYADPRDRFVYACDLGTDELLVFKLNNASGKLSPTEQKSARLAPGSGPRHLAFTADGKRLFVVSEMACSLTEFNLDGRSGTPTMVASLPTLSRPATPADTAAELLIHPSGKWLYASTRGANSIAVFGLYADGKLTRTEIVGAGVKTPRGMAIDPLGRYLIVAGQASDDLTTFEIDPTSGKLTPTGQRVSVPKPVSIAFFSGFKGN